MVVLASTLLKRGTGRTMTNNSWLAILTTTMTKTNCLDTKVANLSREINLLSARETIIKMEERENSIRQLTGSRERTGRVEMQC